jgi:formylglycine-generating enzyme required for sulfatase activity
LQQQVEQALDMLVGDQLDDLIDAIMVLEDRSRRSSRMFVAWWAQQYSQPQPTAAPERTAEHAPVRGVPWSNSLGMTFTPVDDLLVSVWPTRLQDFRTFVVESGYRATTGHFHSWDGNTWRVQGHNWMNPGFKQGPTHPIVGIMWEEAVRFCDWLTEKERQLGTLSRREAYRLPTDAEWTVLVGDTTYPWGNDWPPSNEAGNYGMLLHDRPGTTEVGSFPPNQLGLHDLGGNVWEWCDGYYRKEMVPDALRQQVAFLSDDSGGDAYRFLRGGSWFNTDKIELMSAYRNAGKFPDARFANCGFRCILDFGR